MSPFYDRVASNADFKKEIEPGQGHEIRLSELLRPSGLRSFSYGSHDEWNIARMLNDRRRGADSFGIPNQLAIFFDGQPLSNDPIVITGSANFSGASVDTNHENMLVIRGDKRVADIYLGEFMRQFTSYAFRDAAKASSQKGDPADFRP